MSYMTFVNQKGPQGDQFASFLQTAMSKQDSAFLIDVTRNGWAEFYCFWVIFVCVASLIAVTFLNIKIKKIFDQTKDIVTKKTQEMQNNLIKTLKFLTEIYFFFLFLPLCLTFLNILGVIENLYIVNMKPYRNFVLKVIKKTIRMTVRETTSTTDTANKVAPNLNKRRQTLESKNVREAW
uniref:Uncharacterized protein n=1 Tax=Acrobeloides nanus TaxID=290746 RepID=A0A914EN88_9BILA